MPKLNPLNTQNGVTRVLSAIESLNNLVNSLELDMKEGFAIPLCLASDYEDDTGRCLGALVWREEDGWRIEANGH